MTCRLNKRDGRQQFKMDRRRVRRYRKTPRRLLATTLWDDRRYRLDKRDECQRFN
jgi:hypothetical protein